MTSALRTTNNSVEKCPQCGAYWRDLSDREVIREGDQEMYRDQTLWIPVDDDTIGCMPKQWPEYRFRTRRPL